MPEFYSILLLLAGASLMWIGLPLAAIAGFVGDEFGKETLPSRCLFWPFLLLLKGTIAFATVWLNSKDDGWIDTLAAGATLSVPILIGITALIWGSIVCLCWLIPSLVEAQRARRILPKQIPRWSLYIDYATASINQQIIPVSIRAAILHRARDPPITCPH